MAEIEIKLIAGEVQYTKTVKTGSEITVLPLFLCEK